MGKGSGSFWDNPFGGLFDFNHDGVEDFGEQWLAMQIFRECAKEESSDDDFLTFSMNDDFDDAEDEYAWRENCEDGSDVGIDPDDYETEEEYNEALKNAKIAQTKPAMPAVSLSFQFSFPGQEALNAIKESDYPNKRKYDAAYYLCNVKQGTAFISEDSSPEKEIAKCEFILNSDTVAAMYLTVFDGFLFAQAVKENFSLPIAIPDEDKEVITCFDDLFMELADEDTPLAVTVWSWCIKEFGTYCHYMKRK